MSLALAVVLVVPAGLGGCSSGDDAGAALPAGAVPGAAATSGPGRPGSPSGEVVGDGAATVAPQPEPLPPSPAGTGAGGGVAGVLRAIRSAGLPAAHPRDDDCRALPPGMADGCVEIVRTDTITVWRFETDAAARRYVAGVTGPAGGVAHLGYVVELPPRSAADLRDRYREALRAVG